MNDNISGAGFDYTNFSRAHDDKWCVRCRHHISSHGSVAPIEKCWYETCKCPVYAKDNLEFVEQEAKAKGL